VLALRHLFAGGASDVFNLGTETGTSVNGIIGAVERISGNRVRHSYGQRRDGDPLVLVASAAKARDMLGWKPQRSDIETIIEHAWRWHAGDVLAGERGRG
jgi:UDP-glucose 4-epimerase